MRFWIVMIILIRQRKTQAGSIATGSAPYFSMIMLRNEEKDDLSYIRTASGGFPAGSTFSYLYSGGFGCPGDSRQTSDPVVPGRRLYQNLRQRGRTHGTEIPGDGIPCGSAALFLRTGGISHFLKGTGLQHQIPAGARERVAH